MADEVGVSTVGLGCTVRGSNDIHVVAVGEDEEVRVFVCDGLEDGV